MDIHESMKIQIRNEENKIAVYFNDLQRTSSIALIRKCASGIIELSSKINQMKSVFDKYEKPIK